MTRLRAVRTPSSSPRAFSREIRRLQKRWNLPKKSIEKLGRLAQPAKNGRPALQISIGTVVQAHYRRLDLKKFLRRVGAVYKSRLADSGSIDLALASTRTYFRKRGRWLGKSEWNIIGPALRSSQKLATAGLAAELAVLPIKDARHRDAVRARLLNRRLFYLPKAH